MNDYKQVNFMNNCMKDLSRGFKVCMEYSEKMTDELRMKLNEKIVKFSQKVEDDILHSNSVSLNKAYGFIKEAE